MTSLSEREFLALISSGNVIELKRQTKKMEKKKLFLLVNTIARKGRTPLHIACERSLLELIEFLVVSGANVNALDSGGWSPLAVSAREKALSSCSILLKSGADPNLHTFGSETTALHQLLRIHPFTSEVETVLEMMLKLGAQIDAKNAEGETGLDYAITKSNLYAVRFLLRHGANPNVPNLVGNTGLHIAILTAMKRLGTNQIDDDTSNSRKKKKKNNLETQKSIILALLKSGADPMIKGSHGSVFDLLEINPLSSLELRHLFYTEEGELRTEFGCENQSIESGVASIELKMIQQNSSGEKGLGDDIISSQSTPLSTTPLSTTPQSILDIKEKDNSNNNNQYGMILMECDGYRIEEGACLDPSPQRYKLDLFIFRQLYSDFFYKKKHINLLGYMWSDEAEPMIVSVRDSPESDKRYMGLIRTKYDGQRQFFIEPSEINTKKKLAKEFNNYLCNVFFLGSSLIRVKDPSLEDSLKNLETSDPERKRTLSFGVVYGKGEQTKGIEFFNNENGSEEFEVFLKALGAKIELSSWTGFRGGLGYERCSIFTVFKDFDIMFHVSTLLPYDPLDPGKLGRANRIGNDVCVIVFHEGHSVSISPDCITSNVCQVFIFVRPVVDSDGKRGYRVAVARKKDVPNFEPEVPVILHSEADLRYFLLMKVINGQMAAQRSTLGRMFVTPRRVKIEEIVHNYFPPIKLKPKK